MQLIVINILYLNYKNIIVSIIIIMFAFDVFF